MPFDPSTARPVEFGASPQIRAQPAITPGSMALRAKLGLLSKAPAGYRYNASGNLEPIPGGLQEFKDRTMKNKAAAAYLDLDVSRRGVYDAIRRARKQVGMWTAGPGSVLKHVPGTGATDLSATLDQIKANIGFDKLQEMRANSPTGGALGQVSDMENRMLQAVLGSLDQTQSPEQLSMMLDKIDKTLRERDTLRKLAFAKDYGEIPTQQSQVSSRTKRIASDQEYNALPSGTHFVGPDGKERVKP